MNFISAVTIANDSAELLAGIDGQIDASSDGPADLALAFVNSSDGDSASDLIQGLHSASGASNFLACTAGGVIGGGREVEDVGGASMIVGSLPEVAISGFYLSEGELSTSLTDSDTFRSALALDVPPKLFIILAEPFTTPVKELLAAFNQTFPGVPVVGGIASGGSSPGMNALGLNDDVYRSGTVGLAVGGDVDVEVIVSQGCQALGPLLMITESERNVITGLEGESPLKVLRSLFADLDPRRKKMVQNGVLIGVVADGDCDDPGPSDFLIRNIAGADESSGALAVTDIVTPGQRISFFARDGESATDDLEMLLSPQAFADPPAAALLFTCNGRGKRLFNHDDGDISVVKRALGDDLPVAGFFCAGEIGPIGTANHVHGQTASLVLLRSTGADRSPLAGGTQPRHRVQSFR